MKDEIFKNNFYRIVILLSGSGFRNTIKDILSLDQMQMADLILTNHIPKRENVVKLAEFFKYPKILETFDEMIRNNVEAVDMITGEQIEVEVI